MWRPSEFPISSLLISCLILLQTSALPFIPSSLLLPSHTVPYVPLFKPNIQCYNNGTFPVSGYGCLELTRAMLIAHNSLDVETRNTGNTSIEWVYGGAPCIVKVGAYTQNASVSDSFNWRGVALQAMEVLRSCGSGDERVSWGGKGPVGNNSLFWVEVTSGINSTLEGVRMLSHPSGSGRLLVEEKKTPVSDA